MTVKFKTNHISYFKRKQSQHRNGLLVYGLISTQLCVDVGKCAVMNELSSQQNVSLTNEDLTGTKCKKNKNMICTKKV